MQLLAAANFEGTPLEFIFGIRNEYHDFSNKFYLEVGSIIVQTMLIQSMLPFINLAQVAYTNYALRFKDSRFTMFDQTPKTSLTTVQQYIENVAGPEVQLEIQYSYIFVTIFTTFTFGLAIPILFPIALFSLINLYISNRIMLAYFYRKPPMFAGGMNIEAL